MIRISIPVERKMNPDTGYKVIYDMDQIRDLFSPNQYVSAAIFVNKMIALVTKESVFTCER